MTKIVTCENRKDLEAEAANTIAKSVKSLLAHQKTVVLAVPGGRSMSGIFGLLKKADIPWEKVHIFMVDERLVPISDDDNNFKLAKEHFIDDLVEQGKLPKENVHPFIMESAKEDFGISDYEAEIKKYSGCYDIVLLSSGEDGHVGALYPNHHSVNDESEFFLTMDDSPKPPKQRMTSSRRLLLKSKYAVIIFMGESKREAFEKFQSKALDVYSLPAKLIYSIKNSYALTGLKG